MKRELYGLVVCGGKSTRMGTDKSLINYHGKPQRYYVYEMLEWVCDKVFISCNRSQATSIIAPYQILADLPDLGHVGPMAALLTAFSAYPDKDFLVVGCDYPFVTTKDLKEFEKALDREQIASAFYNGEHEVYEPLLAYYSERSGTGIFRMYNDNQYSLQHFLKENNAEKYNPARPKHVVSIDTPEDFEHAKEKIRLKSYL